MILQNRIELCHENFGALKSLFLVFAEKGFYPDQQNDLAKIFKALEKSFCKIETKKQKEIAKTLESYKGRDNCSLLLELEKSIKEEEIDRGVISIETVVKKVLVVEHQKENQKQVEVLATG